MLHRKAAAENRGYGCYIAYELSKRCGWTIDAYNLQTSLAAVLK